MGRQADDRSGLVVGVDLEKTLLVRENGDAGLRDLVRHMSENASAYERYAAGTDLASYLGGGVGEVIDRFAALEAAQGPVLRDHAESLREEEYLAAFLLLVGFDERDAEAGSSVESRVVSLVAESANADAGSDDRDWETVRADVLDAFGSKDPADWRRFGERYGVDAARGRALRGVLAGAEKFRAADDDYGGTLAFANRGETLLDAIADHERRHDATIPTFLASSSYQFHLNGIVEAVAHDGSPLAAHVPYHRGLPGNVNGLHDAKPSSSLLLAALRDVEADGHRVEAVAWAGDKHADVAALDNLDRPGSGLDARGFLVDIGRYDDPAAALAANDAEAEAVVDDLAEFADRIGLR